MTDDVVLRSRSRASLRRARVVEPWPQAWDDIPLQEFTDGRDWNTLPPGYRRKSKPRRPRKPDVRKLIADAEKLGKSVSSVTMPDGTTLHFGEPVSAEASNPWLADLKVTRQ